MKIPHVKLTRDLVLFIGGLIGLLHETFYVEEPREVLVLAFLAMTGLPAFIHLDERDKPKK